MTQLCETVYVAAWSDQGLPCGKTAVAKCSDCGSAICSDCCTECCGDSFCVVCYDYHLTQSCLRKPVQNARHPFPLSDMPDRTDCCEECCGQSFCELCYDHLNSCLRKPVQNEHHVLVRTGLARSRCCIRTSFVYIGLSQMSAVQGLSTPLRICDLFRRSRSTVRGRNPRCTPYSTTL